MYTQNRETDMTRSIRGIEEQNAARPRAKERDGKNARAAFSRWIDLSQSNENVLRREPSLPRAATNLENFLVLQEASEAQNVLHLPERSLQGQMAYKHAALPAPDAAIRDPRQMEFSFVQSLGNSGML